MPEDRPAFSRLLNMKTIAPQFDLPGQESAFNLALLSAPDPDRLKREADAAAQAAADAAERERQQQPPLFPS